MSLDNAKGIIDYSNGARVAPKQVGVPGPVAGRPSNELQFIERAFVGSLSLPFNKARRYLLIQNQSYDTGTTAGPQLLVAFAQIRPVEQIVTSFSVPYIIIVAGGYYEPYNIPNNYLTFYFIDPQSTGNPQNGYVIEGM